MDALQLQAPSHRGVVCITELKRVLLPSPHRRPEAWQRRRGLLQTQLVQAARQESYVLVDPSPRSAPEVAAGGRPTFLGLSAPAWVGLGIAAAALVWGVGRAQRGITPASHAARREQEALLLQEQSMTQDPTNSREYKMALARTRQAVSVHKALQFQAQGNPARAMVELRRALQENAVVREPLLNARYEKEELRDLYRLHLQNAEVPAKFSTLLQLREMLDIDAQTGEALEQELLQSGSSFSI